MRSNKSKGLASDLYRRNTVVLMDSRRPATYLQLSGISIRRRRAARQIARRRVVTRSKGTGLL